jgi:methyltransferase
LVPAWYLILVGLVALDRLVEMAYSRHNQRRMTARGARKVYDPVFAGMVALHVGYLCAAPLEVLLLGRPFLPWLGWPMFAIFLAANALRIWAIRSLSVHWNMQIVASQSLGAVETGPYRWIRHPNYVAIFLEVASLPLIYTAWLTAAVATCSHLILLRRRIQAEEDVLMMDPVYRTRMGLKPRFLPVRLRPAIESR